MAENAARSKRPRRTEATLQADSPAAAQNTKPGDAAAGTSTGPVGGGTHATVKKTKPGNVAPEVPQPIGPVVAGLDTVNTAFRTAIAEVQVDWEQKMAKHFGQLMTSLSERVNERLDKELANLSQQVNHRIDDLLHRVNERLESVGNATSEGVATRVDGLINSLTKRVNERLDHELTSAHQRIENCCAQMAAEAQQQLRGAVPQICVAEAQQVPLQAPARAQRAAELHAAPTVEACRHAMEGLDEVPNIPPGIDREELNRIMNETQNIRDLVRLVMALVFTPENMPPGVQVMLRSDRHFVERCLVFFDMHHPPDKARVKWMQYSTMITDHCQNFIRRHRPVLAVNDDGGIVGEEGAVGGGAVQQHADVVEEVPLVAQEVVVESVDVVVAGDNGAAKVNDEHVTGDSGSMEATAEDVSVNDVEGDNVSFESTGRDASGEESQ